MLVFAYNVGDKRCLRRTVKGRPITVENPIWTHRIDQEINLSETLDMVETGWDYGGVSCVGF